MENKKLFIIRIVSFTLALLIMAFIFSMSAQDSETSSSTSGGLIETVIRFLDRGFTQLSEIEQQEYIGRFQFIVRKLAHFSIYFALGFTLSMGMQTFVNLKILRRTVTAFLFGVLYAISDEIHQIFVSGRSCELRDVLIDSSGVFLGCIFVVLFVMVLKMRKRAD